MKKNQILDSKTVVVTGAGRGIGKALAIGFADAGAVVVCSGRTQEQLDATTTTINDKGGRAIAIRADVTNGTEVNNLMKSADERMDGIDILIANAGTTTEGSIVNSNPTEWWRVLEVNLLGTYLCARAVIPYMQNRGAGHIITIGSGMGQRAYEKHSAYGCSKAGLSMLTRVLASELWPQSINVNELVPGPVSTDMNRDRPDQPSQLGSSEWTKMPKDVVPLALFLVTQPERGPTGQQFSLMRRDM